MSSQQTTYYPLRHLLVSLALLCSLPVHADTVNVAVASNFVTTLEAIATEFAAATDHDIRVIRGSSGKHYAQIRSGAPFDVFLSADQQRPRRLVEEGIADGDSLRTYALGQLALWSSNGSLELDQEYLLNTNNYETLSIANPRLAPYGQAAQQVLQALGIAERAAPKLVLGENIAQAFQFVYSGNAQLGLIAYSQAFSPKLQNAGSVWPVPATLHAPIRQDLVLLHDTVASREFLVFMAGVTTEKILRAHGYLLPGDTP